MSADGQYVYAVAYGDANIWVSHDGALIHWTNQKDALHCSTFQRAKIICCASCVLLSSIPFSLPSCCRWKHVDRVHGLGPPGLGIYYLLHRWGNCLCHFSRYGRAPAGRVCVQEQRLRRHMDAADKPTSWRIVHMVSQRNHYFLGWHRRFCCWLGL